MKIDAKNQNTNKRIGISIDDTLWELYSEMVIKDKTKARQVIKGYIKKGRITCSKDAVLIIINQIRLEMM